MVKKYEVKVIEELSRVVEIEANSYEEAQELVEEKYDMQEIILDYDDLIETTFRPYPPKKIKENFMFEVHFDKDENRLVILNHDLSDRVYNCETEHDLNTALKDYISDIAFELIELKKDSGKRGNNKNKELIER